MNKCNGVRLRYRERTYRTKRGGVKFERELLLLARLSCPGCRVCGGVRDAWETEDCDAIEISAALCDGDVAVLSVEIDSCDPETGQVDDWHLVAGPVAP